MVGIVKLPHIVKQAQQVFGDLVYAEPRRQHFAEYLTGLLVAER